MASGGRRRGVTRESGLAGAAGRLALGLALAFAAGAAAAQEPQPKAGSIDAVQAGRYFQEAASVCERDAGRMWGTNLYGALMFVDPDTRDLVANRPDYKNQLSPRGDVFAGTLPTEENVANTSARWAGVTWTMLRWPLPEEQFERDKLMVHELYHRVQDQLGLGGPDTSSDHLDTRDGRVWMQLEWRALGAAVVAKKDAGRKAAEDALTFRAYRRSLFKDSGAREQALEMHEGLAEYTGVVLCAKSRSAAALYAAAALAGAPKLTTFVRSFAYVTGPAYGLLLDDASPDWRKGLKAQDDLGDLLAKAIGAVLPPDLKAAAETRAKAYGGKDLMASEDALFVKKKQETASLRARFVDGPVLILPLREAFSYSFDSTDQVPLEGFGTVYPFVRVVTSWGVLEATNGALLVVKDSVIAGIRLPAPKDASARPLKGDGWTLDVKDGWSVVPGPRPGDLELKRTSPGLR